jgi:hypothetical protein
MQSNHVAIATAAAAAVMYMFSMYHEVRG